MQSEISQSPKEKFCMIPLMIHLELSNSSDRKQTSSWQWLQGGENVVLVLMSTEFQYGKMKKILEMNNDDVCKM